MNKSEVIALAEKLLSDSKTAVLSTVSESGQPRMRWMSPVFLRNLEGFIYAVTSKDFSKALDIEKNEKVQWMVQSISLDTIITFEGRSRLIDNIALRTEVVESVGHQLQTFWTINKDTTSLTAIETEIESAVVFLPSKGKKHVVSFKGGSK